MLVGSTVLTFKRLVCNRCLSSFLRYATSALGALLQCGSHATGSMPYCTFLAQAEKDGILPQDSATVNCLSLSLRQQLERASFAQHLASAMTEAAQQLTDLQDRPDLIAAGLAKLKQNPLDAKDPFSMSSSAWVLVHIDPHLKQLTFLLQMLGFLWPQAELMTRTLPALIHPVMQLLVRLMQHASLFLSQLPDNLEEHPLQFVPMMAHLLVQSCAAADATVVHAAVYMLNSLPNPQQQQQQQMHQMQQQQQQQ